MANGALGNPLKKGKSQTITTYLIDPAVTYVSKAGRMVMLKDSPATEQSIVVLAGGGNEATLTPHGILTHDLMFNRVDSDANGVCSVTERGSNIPVQVDGDITDLTKGVGFTATGLFCQGDSVSSVGIVAGKFLSTTKGVALDENGKEVACAFLELISPHLPSTAAPAP